jgi:three-Cys-motif partner protein
MPDKHPTIWGLAAHTAAKHAILRGYMGAWLPKLAWARRIVFIDGFAGPGEYSGGEPGSPLIAVDVAVTHKADLSGCEIIFAFVEEDPARYEHLTGLLESIQVPDNLSLQHENSEFEAVLTEALNKLDADGHNMAPAFVMVDPFGFKGLSMNLLARLAKHPRSELLVSFMYESINRWLGQSQLAGLFDKLFGDPNWREALKLKTAQERLDFLHNLYVSQLKAVGMTFTRSFLMLDSGNKPEYFLIFATKSLDGLKAMKRAMWKVAPAGNFQFSDATKPDQLTLFDPKPDFGQLKGQIIEKFSGVSKFTVDELENFVVVDTAFLESHFKKNILVPMEKADELEVLASPRKKALSYPAGTVMRLKG